MIVALIRNSIAFVALLPLHRGERTEVRSLAAQTLVSLRSALTLPLSLRGRGDPGAPPLNQQITNVVNNSAIFLLAIGRASVINGFNVNSMEARPNHQNGHGSFGVVSPLIRIALFVDSLSPQRACG